MVKGKEMSFFKKLSFSLILMLFIVFFHLGEIHGQCGGDLIPFVMTATESTANVSVEADRNRYWTFGGNDIPVGALPSESYEISFNSLGEEFPCLNNVPIQEVIVELAVTNFQFDRSSRYTCCEPFFEGLFANLYQNCTTNDIFCTVNGDGLNNSNVRMTGDCNPSADHAVYDNGFEVGFPFSSRTECLNVQSNSNIGIGLVPSFRYEDVNDCPCTQELISDGLLSIQFEVNLIYLICENNIPSLNDLPEFEPFEAICESSDPFDLPLESDDGVTGTWDIPTVDPSGMGGSTLTVTFTPDPGQCTELSYNANIEILSGEPASFDAIGPICENADPISLPIMSSNGFTGDWDVGTTFDPSGFGGSSATLTFVPDDLGCTAETTIVIEVLSPEAPTFDPIVPLCESAEAITLPTSSSNGYTGTWDVGTTFDPNGQGGNMVPINFMPEDGQCVEAGQISIEVQSAIVPTFDEVEPICFDATPIPLPMSSNEGVSGTWDVGAEFDPVGLTGANDIIFSPDMDQCALEATQSITVGNIEVPNIISKLCSPSLMDYAIELSTTGDRIASSLGTVVDMGGVYRVEGVPVDMEAVITVFDDSFGCDRDFPISAPNCNCPNVDTPTGTNREVCKGAPLGMIAADPGSSDLSINWYDAPAGGTLLSSESLTYSPSDPGMYYAESVDPQSGCVSNNRVTIEIIEIPLDTAYDSAITCDPLMVGIVSTVVPTATCDSVIITETTLVLGDTTYLSGSTCDPIVAGTFDTLYDNNAMGCDSLIIIEYALADADTMRISVTSCDPSAIPIDTMIFSTDQCDSVVITTTTLAMSDEIFQMETTCDPLLATIDTVFETNQNGCDSLVITETILDEGITSAIIDPMQPVCNGSSGVISIMNVVGGDGPYLYSIDNGDSFSTDPVFSDLLSGDYAIVIEDAFGCQFSVAEELFSGGDIEVTFEQTQIEIGFGQSVPLSPSVSGSDGMMIEFVWTPSATLSCDRCQYPIASPSEQTTYTVRVNDEFGCIDSAQVTITLGERDLTYFPTAFSPNGDGVNDYFTVFAAPGYVDRVSRLAVYDRWGVKLFENVDFAPNVEIEGWDGRMGNDLINSGVYVYSGEVILSTGLPMQIMGEITVIR